MTGLRVDNQHPPKTWLSNLVTMATVGALWHIIVDWCHTGTVGLNQGGRSYSVPSLLTLMTKSEMFEFRVVFQTASVTLFAYIVVSQKRLLAATSWWHHIGQERCTLWLVGYQHVGCFFHLTTKIYDSIITSSDTITNLRHTYFAAWAQHYLLWVREQTRWPILTYCTFNRKTFFNCIMGNVGSM